MSNDGGDSPTLPTFGDTSPLHRSLTGNHPSRGPPSRRTSRSDGRSGIPETSATGQLFPRQPPRSFRPDSLLSQQLRENMSPAPHHSITHGEPTPVLRRQHGHSSEERARETTQRGDIPSASIPIRGRRNNGGIASSRQPGDDWRTAVDEDEEAGALPRVEHERELGGSPLILHRDSSLPPDWGGGSKDATPNGELFEGTPRNGPHRPPGQRPPRPEGSQLPYGSLSDNGQSFFSMSHSPQRHFRVGHHNHVGNASDSDSEYER